MPKEQTRKILQIIREKNVLKPAAIERQRAEFEKFLLQFSSNLDTDIEILSINRIPAFRVSGPGVKVQRTILFFHGGGFTLGSTRDHLDLCSKLCRAAGAQVISVDYRLAPEHPFPAAVNDCFASYRWLLNQKDVQPKKIIMAGISSGGTLVLTTLLLARDTATPLPAAGVCLSPLVDIRFRGKSVRRNRETDWITREWLETIYKYYADGADPKLPLLSPVYAELAALPPILIQAGGGELLVDDVRKLINQAEHSNASIDYEIWDDMFHCWHLFSALLPEGQMAINSAGEFMRRF